MGEFKKARRGLFLWRSVETNDPGSSVSEQPSRGAPGRHVLIHDQERSQAVEVISVSFSGKVVSNVGDICSFTNVGNVRHAVGVEGDLCKHSRISLSGSLQITLIYVATLYRHGNHIGVHAGA